jgi:hypothetical protein
MFESVRMINPLAIGSAPEAGPYLRFFASVCLNTDDLSVLNVGF